MGKLGEVATFIRSKNAGPFTCTIDILFATESDYEHATRSEALSPQRIGELYGLSADRVRVFSFAPAHAVKVSIPRAVSCGDPADTDVMGGQLFVPLLDLDLAG